MTKSAPTISFIDEKWIDVPDLLVGSHVPCRSTRDDHDTVFELPHEWWGRMRASESFTIGGPKLLFDGQLFVWFSKTSKLLVNIRVVYEESLLTRPWSNHAFETPLILPSIAGSTQNQVVGWPWRHSKVWHFSAVTLFILEGTALIPHNHSRCRFKYSELSSLASMSPWSFKWNISISISCHVFSSML